MGEIAKNSPYAWFGIAREMSEGCKNRELYGFCGFLTPGWGARPIAPDCGKTGIAVDFELISQMLAGATIVDDASLYWMVSPFGARSQLAMLILRAQALGTKRARSAESCRP